MKIFKIVLIVISIFFVFSIFHNWFDPATIVSSSGDSGYYYSSTFHERVQFLSAWMPERGDGLGGIYYPLLWSGMTVGIPLFLLGNVLHNWSLIEKIAYFIPFLLIGFVAPFFLFKKIFSRYALGAIASLVFLTNTYILMIVSGGQMMIALAYVWMPLVVWQAILLHEFTEKRKQYFASVLLGALLSVQVLFDIRIAYITFFAILIYAGFHFLGKRNIHTLQAIAIFTVGIPLLIVIMTHAFWILPTFLAGQNPVIELGSNYSSVDAVRFFSFAKLEYAISLLHPNWFDNIFGKVNMFFSAFLLLPLLAFGSLLFVSKENTIIKRYVGYFALLGIIGIFLAKGTQDPFGEMYVWTFSHMPGFSLFRDPTKWYVLIALSYAMLIPFSLENIVNKIMKGKK